MSQLVPDDEAKQKEARGWQLLLGLFDADPDRAGEKFVRLSIRLEKLIESNPVYDPHSVFDRMIKRVCIRLDEGLVIRNIFGYLTNAARNASRESVRVTPRSEEPDDIETDQHSLPNQEQVIINREEELEEVKRKALKKRCLDECLGQLRPEQRLIIKRYYLPERDKETERKKLAEFMGITRDALKTRVSRIKDVLRKCIEPCLQACGIPVKPTSRSSH
jgi:RNA polymerase sigma factor (sigma-70 family)